MILYPSPFRSRGALHEASWSGPGCGACGRGVTYPMHSGGRGSPSGPTTGPCLRWLDWDRLMAGKPAGCHVPGSTVLPPQIAAVERRKAFPWPLIPGVPGITLRPLYPRRAFRRSAAPHCHEERKCQHNSGAWRRENAEACDEQELAPGCLKFESDVASEPRSSTRCAPPPSAGSCSATRSGRAAGRACRPCATAAAGD